MTDTLAVAAVGGYGRRELTPGSDIDLAFLYRGRNASAARDASSAVLYPLWDAGFRVSYSVRTVAECRQEAQGHLDSLTALLNIRFLSGDRVLVGDARREARSVAEKPRGRFASEVARSRDQRAARFGSVGRMLEPDLKESLGGQRDAQVIGWFGAVLGEPADADLSDERAPLDTLQRIGVLSKNEAASVEVVLDLLLLSRTALHRASRGPANRLVSEHQDAVAALLGVRGEDAWEPRDALMRDLIVAARRLERIADGITERVGRLAAKRAPSTVPVRRDVGFEASAMEAFAQVAESRGEISPDDRDWLEDEASRHGTLEWSPRVLAAFLRILRSGSSGSRALEDMESLELLWRFIDEWGSVRGRPQRDPYHRLPVDVHLLTTCAEVARLLVTPDEPFATEAVGLVGNDEAVLLGAFLHDIGKVGRGSHVLVGAEMADRAVMRMGVSDDVRDTVQFLVREHLLLSDTATRRDLQDEDLVLHVAARVGDARRLAMLYLLTVADAVSTGPSASTPWRMTLIRELVAKVNRAFERGLMDRDRADRLTRAESAFRHALEGGAAGPETIEAFLEAVPPAYLLTVDPSDAASHLRLVTPPPASGDVRMAILPGRYSGSATLSVGTRDRAGLLATITGALTLSGLSIHSANAFTTEDGVALDVFEVRSAFEEEEISEERWERFRARLEGGPDVRELDAAIRTLRAHYRDPPRDVPVEVRLDETASDFYTVVEVHGPDRLGLLFDLARTFSENRTDVHSAKVATYGPRVVDVFYVTDETGLKLTDPIRLEQLVQALSRVTA
jgi:[protein-PII] uridylyltransferase